MMQRAHCKVQRLLTLPLGIEPGTLDPMVTSIILQLNGKQIV